MLEQVPNNNDFVMWKCQCECGEVRNIFSNSLLNGVSKSCGCYNKSSEYRNKQRQWRDDNKDKVTEMTNNIIKWNEENKESLKERGKRYSEWAASNKEKVSEIHTKQSEWHKTNRRNSDISELLSIVHPDYVQSLLDGKLTTHDMVKTKCPVCGEYDDHCLNNVFRFKTSKFRYRPPLCRNCRNSFTSSRYENEIADYISTFYAGKLIKNDRIVLNGKELDLYYTEKKIAIEFNGDYWHSDEFKSNHYHYDKFKQCYDNGIVLVSIFEHKWITDCEIIKAYLHNLFSNNKTKLSFMVDGYMDNNYPSRECCGLTDTVKEDFYLLESHKIYTCGYTKLL